SARSSVIRLFRSLSLALFTRMPMRTAKVGMLTVKTVCVASAMGFILAGHPALQRLLDGGPQIGFRREAFETLHLLPRAVEDQRHRQWIQLVLLVERLAAQAYRVFHRVLFEEGLYTRGALLIHRDAQHRDALPGQVLMQFVEAGNL